MIDFLKQKRIGPEVFHATDRILDIGKADMLRLCEIAAETPRLRSRFCSHGSAEESIQEMFIVHPKDAYVRPHRHLNKVESMLVLSGTVQYITFTDEGNVESSVKMGSYESGSTFYHSMRKPKFHSMIIESEWLVFLEITQGPFRKEDSEFAAWSPEDSKTEQVRAFLEKLREQTA